MFKVALLAAVGTHLAGAIVALKDAVSHSDFVWDTAGFERKSWLVRIVALPVAGARQYVADVKPKLEQAEAAVELQGG